MRKEWKGVYTAPAPKKTSTASIDQVPSSRGKRQGSGGDDTLVALFDLLFSTISNILAFLNSIAL